MQPPRARAAARTRCYVLSALAVVGVPTLLSGIITMSSLCSPWGRPDGSWVSWSVFDSTLMCCNSSCPEVVFLSDCEWHGGTGNSSGQFGGACVVGHVPSVEWCWSDSRCQLGNYAWVGLSIAQLTIGSSLSFAALFLGLIHVRRCARLTAVGLAERRAAERLMAVAWLRRKQSGAFLAATTVHRLRAAWLPHDLRMRVLEYVLPPPPSIEAAEWTDEETAALLPSPASSPSALVAALWRALRPDAGRTPAMLGP